MSSSRLVRALRTPVHPVLFALVPVLLLWATNAGEVLAADVVSSIVLAVAIAMALTLVSVLGARSLHRGAVVGSIATLIVLTHGYLWGQGRLAVVVGVPVALVLLVLAVGRLLEVDDIVIDRMCLAANLAAVAMVALVAVPIAPVLFGGRPTPDLPPVSMSSPPAPSAAASPESEKSPAAVRRDVVWIVPDRYGSAGSLRTAFGIDNLAFEHELTDRGFLVLDDARANYPRTTHSLSAQLNLSSLDRLRPAVPASWGDRVTPLYDLLADHEVGRLLTSSGYEYVHIGGWWGPTASATAGDDVRRLDPRTEFAAAFENRTLLASLGLVTADVPARHLDRVRATAEHQLDQLEQVAQELVADPTDAPRLVFVHVALPHEPYVFEADGSPVDAATASSRTEADSFARQLAHLNDRLLQVVDVLGGAAAEHAPIVLVQADEGPHPVGFPRPEEDPTRWATASDEQLVAKFSILSAVRAPGLDEVSTRLPAGVTGANVARVVVETALDTEIPPVSDRSWIMPDERSLYRYVDVTDRIDAAIR